MKSCFNCNKYLNCQIRQLEPPYKRLIRVNYCDEWQLLDSLRELHSTQGGAAGGSTNLCS